MQRSVHVLLDSVAEAPQPPTTVDVRAAMRVGRRRVRVRRLVVAGCSGLAVVIMIGAVALLKPAMSDPDHLASQRISPSAVASSAPAMPASAPSAFDPLVRYAEFGWLPDGLIERHSATGSDWMRLQAGRPMVPTDKDPSYVALSVVTAGKTIDSTRLVEFAVEPGQVAGDLLDAEPINGRPALWNAGGAALGLRWEYAPGAWAEVFVSNLEGDAKTIARRVAQDVRFGANSTVTLPFQPSGLPASLRPAAVNVSVVLGSDGQPSAARWTASVEYGTTARRPASGDWPLVITAVASDARTGDGAATGNPNGTLDGHPARRMNLGDGGRALQVFDVDGVYLELMTHSATTTASISGGLDALFRNLNLNPHPATWR